MTDHARKCEICGQKFGNAWGGVGLCAHRWKEHGIPSQTTFNNEVLYFGPPKKRGRDD